MHTDSGHFEVRYGPMATFLNFKYRCLRRHWQSDACAYDFSDRKFPQEQDLKMLVCKVIRNLVYIRLILNFFYHGPAAPGPRPPTYGGSMITLRHTTLGRTSLDE